MVTHLYNDKEAGNGAQKDSQVELHPAIHDLGIKLIANKFYGTNQTTVAILLAVKEVVREFTQTKRMIYH